MIDRSTLVIIVNYNGGERLMRCLSALAQQSRLTSVLVVDNASTDGSLRRAYDRFTNVEYLPLRVNVGFARAVNIAVSRTSAQSIILLNPDTEPEPEFSEEILKPLEQPGVAAVAGRLVFESRPEIIASAGINVYRNGLAMDAMLGERQDPTEPSRPVFGASGGAAAYSRAAFVEVGGLPEAFFLYQEDVDLAWRLRLHGWEAMTAPAAVARHAYSASAGEGSQLKRRLIARNRIWTIVRCVADPMLREIWPRIASYDAKAAAYGLLRDRASLAGRLEAIARVAPRLCERRSIQRQVRIDPRSLEGLLEAPPTAREQLRLRRLTQQLAVAGSDSSPGNRQ